MINVEKAVDIALSVLTKIMPDYAALKPEVDEFALSKDGSFWNVTFRAKNPEPNPFGGQVFYPYKDKVVQIKANDGELIAIRNPSYD